MRWARVPTDILTRPELDSNDKLVYVALCAHVNADGYAYPRRAVLAEYTSLSLRTITRSLARLREAGVIEQYLRTGTSPMYKVLPLATQSTPPTLGGMDTQAIPQTAEAATPEAVLKLFADALRGHKVGNRAFVTSYITREARPYRWYLTLFEEVSRRPFLCGANERGLKFPLSFLLREAAEILDKGKYKPWTETAEAVAEYLRKEETA